MAAKNIVFFDLETQLTAGDVGGWNNKRDMLMSVGVTYSTARSAYRIYSERTVDALIEELRRADLVVGFNHVSFDYEVLMGYTILDLPDQIASYDLLEHTEKVLGHRVKLDAIAQATLGLGKTADGLDALRWWREGKIREIAEYCCFDVKVTKLVYEHAAQHGELQYLDKNGKKQTYSLRVP